MRPSGLQVEGPEVTQSSPTPSPGLNHLATIPTRSSAASHQLWGNAPASQEAYSISGQEHPPGTWQAAHLSIHPSGTLLTAATLLATTPYCWHCFHLMSLKTLKLFSTPASSQVSPYTCPTSFEMREPTILENSVISLEWNFSEMRPLTGQCTLLHGQRHQLLTWAMPTAPRGRQPCPFRRLPHPLL